MAQDRVPSMPQLYGDMSEPQPQLPALRLRRSFEATEHVASQRNDGRGRRVRRAADRANCPRKPIACGSAAGGKEGNGVPRALHPLRRVHENMPEQRVATIAYRSWSGRLLEPNVDAAGRLLRAGLRAVHRSVSDRRHIAFDPRPEGVASRCNLCASARRVGGLRPHAVPAMG